MIFQEGTLCAEKLLCETWRAKKKKDPGCELCEEQTEENRKSCTADLGKSR
jgi:hypothetical protein